MKKNLITGITISGDLTLANYLVVIKQLKEIAKQYNIFLFIADLHAITTKHNPQELKSLKLKTAIEYIACDVPGNIFIQSEVKGHTELAFVLGCHTKIGELSRMTQFKDKKQAQTTSFGLMNYPVLMAADILLYRADVIVGPDQKQHLELAKTLAKRCNDQFGEIFHVPQLVQTLSTKYRIRNLLEPTKKMSKSTKNKKGIIFLSETPEQVKYKFKIAVTDSENKIEFDFDSKPGISNLILIYSLVNNLSISDATKILQTNCPNYLILKEVIANSVNQMFAPIHLQMKKLKKDSQVVTNILKKGKQNAQKVANQQLTKMKLLGFNFND